MNRLAAVFLVGFFCCAIASPLFAQGSFPLKYRDQGESSEPVIIMAQTYAPAVDKKPAGLKGLPAGMPGQPVYFQVTLGKRNVFFALDGGKPTKLYVDTDVDGDLSDEKPVAESSQVWTKGEEGPSTVMELFGPVTLAGVEKGTEVKVRVRSYGGRFLIVWPAGYVTGEVQLDGKPYRVALADGSFDGRYDTRIPTPFSVTERPAFDSLALDFDRNGKFDYSMDLMEVLPLPRMVQVAGTYYALTVAPDGSNIRLEKITPEFGTLDVGTDAELMLFSDTGIHRLKGAEGKWPLPAGTYAGVMLKLNRTDKDGGKWSLSSMGNTGKLQNFEIRAGQTLSVRIGPPLSVKTDAAMTEGTAYIGLSVVGQGEEEYGGAVEKNGETQDAPALKIVSDSGRVLASGTFEYG